VEYAWRAKLRRKRHVYSKRLPCNPPSSARSSVRSGIFVENAANEHIKLQRSGIEIEGLADAAPDVACAPGTTYFFPLKNSEEAFVNLNYLREVLLIG
jgi:hypothetical protein